MSKYRDFFRECMMTPELQDSLKREYFIASFRKAPQISRDKERFGAMARTVSDYFATVSFAFADERDITESAAVRFAEKNISDDSVREHVSECMKETVRDARAKLGL